MEPRVAAGVTATSPCGVCGEATSVGLWLARPGLKFYPVCHGCRETWYWLEHGTAELAAFEAVIIGKGG